MLSSKTNACFAKEAILPRSGMDLHLPRDLTAQRLQDRGEALGEAVELRGGHVAEKQLGVFLPPCFHLGHDSRTVAGQGHQRGSPVGGVGFPRDEPALDQSINCLLYTSPSPRDGLLS